MRHPSDNCALPIALLVAALLIGGCGNNAEEVVAEQSVRPAKVIRVEAAGVVTAHEFVARVEAAQSIDVSFEVDGVLAELPVLEGQTIERGQLVAALDPTDFRLAVREAELQVELARQDWERKRRLLAQQGIAASLVEDARSMHELQQVRLAQRRESLAKSRITAPFDAYVAHRYVDNFVQVGAKDRVVRLNDLHELQVVAGVPEQLLVTVGTEQVVSIDAIFPFAPEQRFPLALRENRGEADAVAQTYEVSFTMQRPAEYNILPGMTAAVRVILRPEAGAEASPRIPASALVSGPDKDFFVWLYDPETQAVRKQAVQVGPPAPYGVPITSGLQGGEWIVATGANQLQEGMRVRPMNDAPSDS
ncbi:MAG: efflux RND transporter periplasmic adaptor subunit [Gammaproteobacteria bacterium]|nr:efflux RND transporter periplasmic adaptor subunit [Gammaproteobacteria bacterium]